MTPIIDFTPGPSQLFFTVQDHVRKAFKESIPSISHRSKIFETIFEETTSNLRLLLSIPDNFYIFFTGSATEIWDLTLNNLVEKKSFHFVNGAFSQRFYETAIQLRKDPAHIKVEYGKGFESQTKIPTETELIAITQNETSTGVSVPLNWISDLKNQYPEMLITIDAVSSLPYPDIDFKKTDSVFFSVQKGFGLPAGLGVWIVNEECIIKSEQLASQGINIGSFHSLPSLLTFAKKNQTPETPNVLSIYLLGKVINDMLARGITSIRRETEYKAAILYQTLKQHPLLEPFVKEKEFQSKTVIVAETGPHTELIKNALLKKGIQPGSGYGSMKETTLRFANFPAHSKEQFEMLVDELMGIRI